MNKQSVAFLLIIVAIVGIIITKKVTESNAAAARDRAAASSRLLTGDTLEATLKNGKPTLAEFGLGTCEQCKKMAPILAHTADVYRGKVNVVSVDLDEFAATGQFYGIRTMPTQIFFDAKGNEVAEKRHEGFLPQKEIDTILASLGAKK